MDAAQTIRDCLANVTALRLHRVGDAALGSAVVRIKALQARRFRGTYADLMDSPTFGPATRFFLEELYSDTEYTDRDQQFGRIAGTLQNLFPQPAVATAQALAVLHAQTEGLDSTSPSTAARPSPDAAHYIAAWRTVGQTPARLLQLQRVLAMGTDLARLTRLPGLRMLLRMMRAPAHAAGLGALQQFLEAGFDTFGQLARQRSGVAQFLATIEERERALIALMTEADPVACETQLIHTLGQAR